MKHKDANNGPAFPTSTEHGFNNGVPGMTLRDYFAAKAMQGFIAHPEIDGTPQYLAVLSYQMADAMLKAREA